jgi:hypothetical protein
VSGRKVGRPPGLPKSGGRRRGTPNRLTLEVADVLAAIGCNPILGMAQLAMDSDVSAELRFKANAELASYVYPKRKSVDVSVQQSSHVFNVNTSVHTSTEQSDGGNEPENGL